MNSNKDPFSSLKKKVKRNSAKSSKPTEVRINRNVTERIKSHRDARARRRAEYLSRLPKNPLKRFLYYLHPKHFAEYWFNRDGAVRLLKLAGIGLAIILLFTVGVFAYFRKDMPKNITDLKTCSEGASTTYYDRTGKTLLWASSGDVECFPVPGDQISPYIRNAIVAAEDKNYYKHGGFSMDGLLRAAFNNARGGSTQGGSTITQQFVKNSLLTQEQTITRKLKELILAIELERSYTKDEILNAYMNEIPFGSVYNGVEAASRGYFGKGAKDLTVDEAVLLAAVIPAPTYYSPYGENKEELVARQHYIMDEMVAQGLLKKDEVDAAKKVDTLAKIQPIKSKYKDILAPYFVLEVEKQLEKEHGSVNARSAGFRVTTTVDLSLQKYAEDAIKNNIYRIERDGGNNAALVSVDVQTGQVLTHVGGRDFNYPGFGQINFATTPRSPGSSFKPYDYASLMTQNKSWGAGSIFYDVNTDFGGGYKPKDYDLREPGALSMRNSLGGSRNTPAIKAMYMAGIENTHNLAKKMGLVSGVMNCAGAPQCEGILSTAIGDGGQVRLDEHVNSFATFSRMGKYKPITYVLKIEDKRGKTIKEWKDAEGEQVLNPEIAYTVNDMLSDDSARYIRGSSNFNLKGVTTALKTGTTNNSDNGWLMMYSTKIATGVWIGGVDNNGNPKVMPCGVYGCMEGKTGPIMAEYMRKAHEGRAGSADKWTKPAGMKTVCLNPITGYATASGGKCDIFPSWYQPQYPDTTKNAVIDTVSKKLATECTPERAKETITGGGIRSELPTSDPLYNNWIKPVQARYGSSGGAIPTDKDDIHTCDPADKPTVSLKTPTMGPAGTYTFEAEVTKGKFPLTSVTFKIDGTVLSGGSFDITDSGSVTFKYVSTFNEAKMVTVEVLDSALYDATDSKTVSFQTARTNSQSNVTLASALNKKKRKI